MGTELAGLAFAMVLGAGMMLKYIMRRLDKQDDYLKELTSNHLAHNTEALIDMRNAIQELTEAIRERKI